MNEQRIKEVFSDETFVKQLLEQEDAEQVQALLIEKDIDLSIEDVCKIQELMIKQIKGEINLEELSEEELEDIFEETPVVVLMLSDVGSSFVKYITAAVPPIERRRQMATIKRTITVLFCFGGRGGVYSSYPYETYPAESV